MQTTRALHWLGKSLCTVSDCFEHLKKNNEMTKISSFCTGGMLLLVLSVLSTSLASDPHSVSRPDLHRTSHLHLDLEVDFERRIFFGCVTLTLERLDPGASLLLLDAKNLNISSVTSDGRPLEYTEKESDFGDRLEIVLENSTGKVENSTGKVKNSTGKVKKSTGKVENSTEKAKNSTGKMENSTEKVKSSTGKVENSTEKVENSTVKVENSTEKVENSTEKVEVEICYSTSPSSAGLQWLTADQTKAGQSPFVYSQADQSRPLKQFPFYMRMRAHAIKRQRKKGKKCPKVAFHHKALCRPVQSTERIFFLYAHARLFL